MRWFLFLVSFWRIFSFHHRLVRLILRTNHPKFSYFPFAKTIKLEQFGKKPHRTSKNFLFLSQQNKNDTDRNLNLTY